MENIIIRILGQVSKSSLKKFQILPNFPIDTSNQLFCWLFVDYSDFEIQKHFEFNYIFIKPLKECKNINVTLNLITQNQGIMLDFIPMGHKTICKFILDSESKSIIDKHVSIVDTWHESNETSYISNSLELIKAIEV